MSIQVQRFSILVLIVLALFPSRLRAADSRFDAAGQGAAPGDRKGLSLDEIGIGSGYAWGTMKQTAGDFVAVPGFVRIGFDMNPLLGMQARKSTVQLAFEPFVNTVTKPSHGVEAGLDLFVRYLYPVSPGVKLVAEVGSGPMYLSIDTEEQGRAGFNFLNQFGLGTRVAVSKECAFTLGYRFRHLSNGGTASPNFGINSNAIVLSCSILR
jgi:lipid A 3-O-deacylase